MSEHLTATAPLPLRPELIGKEPYGAPQLDVAVRLNTNENPHSPSAALADDIVAAVRDVVTDLNRYPDREATALRSSLADYLTATTGVAHTHADVWAANGSNEVLQQILHAFAGAGRTVLGFEPTYSMHHTIAESTGATYIAAPRDADYRIDAAAVVAAIERHRPDVTFVCTPNNPTGTSTPLETIEAIYDATEGIVVVDEAYIEFSTQPSAVHLLHGRRRLLVSRTMSKAFGFAGARVGYLAAAPEVVDALRLVRLPYHLSSLTQAIALAALRHRDELLATVDAVVGQRDRIARELSALGLTVAPTDANFVLFSAPDGDATGLWRRLVDAGVLIRDVGFADRLRVTAGTEAETTAFLAALRGLL
ncbi:histidinol-phosphate transaminase [Tsukamurella soli]|uniref:Histidinol-phosphate aminotransferase n=1 Tax=Tsukamurella soli TaxID=644556 RepID=A0ABP8KCQ5_9ACTN